MRTRPHTRIFNPLRPPAAASNQGHSYRTLKGLGVSFPAFARSKDRLCMSPPPCDFPHVTRIAWEIKRTAVLDGSLCLRASQGTQPGRRVHQHAILSIFPRCRHARQGTTFRGGSPVKRRRRFTKRKIKTKRQRLERGFEVLRVQRKRSHSVPMSTKTISPHLRKVRSVPRKATYSLWVMQKHRDLPMESTEISTPQKANQIRSTSTLHTFASRRHSSANKARRQAHTAAP